ncbi:MAG: OadG family protein [Lachnospiraceae bacterium]|nr:OadG family protein [Lachnospiraceae bacterium]
MKKKIAFILSIISIIMMLGACGTDPTTVDYNGVTYDALYQEAVYYGTTYNGVTEDELLTQIEALEYLEENPSYNTYGIDPVFFIDLTEKWISTMDECGDFVDLAENGFTVTKSGKTLTTDLILVFENRNVIFQLVYNYHNMELTGVTIEPVYTLGEKMAKAGMNTLISISIVFAVLILISLIISCFKIFPYLEAKKKEKEKETQKATDTNQFVTQIEQREEMLKDEELVDDTELVAVIAAAIAASTGTSTSDFVVRSIKRR